MDIRNASRMDRDGSVPGTSGRDRIELVDIFRLNTDVKRRNLLCKNERCCIIYLARDLISGCAGPMKARNASLSSGRNTYRVLRTSSKGEYAVEAALQAQQQCIEVSVRRVEERLQVNAAFENPTIATHY